MNIMQALLVAVVLVAAIPAVAQNSNLVAEASRGDIKAQLSLGSMYYLGQGAPQDYAKAKYYWELAAAQGDAKAQYNLGVLYQNGHGVRQDYTKAKYYYELAAAQGLAQAQYNLGVLYGHGDGVPQNHHTAKEWYIKACDNLNPVGCNNYRKLQQIGY